MIINKSCWINLNNFNYRIKNVFKSIQNKRYLYIKFLNKNSNNYKISNSQLKYFSEYTPLTLPKKDLYKILEINSSSDLKEIKQAYYKKAKEYHPDKLASKF